MGYCCGAVGITRFISLFGTLFSLAVLSGPAYVVITDKDFSELLPFLKDAHEFLEDEFEKKELTENTLTVLGALLNDISDQAWLGALLCCCAATTNIFLDFLLLIGACCRIRCLLLPWLIFSLIEILILGCPTAIFFSLLGVYLYVEGLLAPAIFSFSAPCGLVVGSLLVWLVVLVAYWEMGKPRSFTDEEHRDLEVQPLMSNESQGGAATSYNLGQYPQYYPPQHQQQQQQQQQPGGPSAPPQTTPTDKNNPHLYPTLPA